MPDVAGISAALPTTGSDSTAEQAITSLATQTENTLKPSNFDSQPAVLVDLSSQASKNVASEAGSKLPSLDPTAVERALAWLGGANGFAFLATHFAYDSVVADFGKEIADRNKAVVTGAAVNAAAMALSYASSLGIPIHVSSDPSKTGAALSKISLDAFSFRSGSSVYSVSVRSDGMMVGTKDGQWWMEDVLDTDAWGAAHPSTVTLQQSVDNSAANKGASAPVTNSIPSPSAPGSVGTVSRLTSDGDNGVGVNGAPSVVADVQPQAGIADGRASPASDPSARSLSASGSENGNSRTTTSDGGLSIASAAHDLSSLFHPAQPNQAALAALKVLISLNAHSKSQDRHSLDMAA